MSLIWYQTSIAFKTAYKETETLLHLELHGPPDPQRAGPSPIDPQTPKKAANPVRL